ncbi:PVC-type heme-binding CxxCH protein [Alienimonas californiensis]|uniref:Cytochrome c domain-containing protein n=1 Tax=Alienimonas californiensis TaxID=2527989 RepID=A0A517P560_9PLAN|nr:PVC-type heme-binding CxxCH protein [Alienimonas californiensis]QDT14518.1 hypothetical protein CA12_05930 [Alienimonas californiensis]
MRLVPALVLLCSYPACGFAGDGDEGDAHEHAFPPIRNTQPDGAEPNTPQQAAEAFSAPEGFEVTLFAGEPDVAQPIAMTFDDRGRLWVAECFTYTSRQFDVDHGDRVTIFEDADGDGAHDQRTVFWDRGFMLTGLEYGFGGLWVLNDGTLSFIPDENRDDVPDGEPGTEPIVMLDGFTFDAGHNVVNGLAWGPDGWLYGRHGITATSAVGAPGTPEANRTLLNCGIWRFHPTRHTFEVVATGTTNPWGLDWNEYGDAFFTNNVIGHAWHLIPGAHYRRMFGQDFNPHLYGLIDQHADHYHWDAGGDWTESRPDSAGAATADDLGGGHSHAGAMIYQGDNWPEEYRGDLYMCNTHGRRINRDRPVPHGSGYKITHQPDFAFANSPWFKGVELKSGPDGGVFLLDWTDLGECHDHDGVHRTSGRIYKITYGKPERAGETVDLASWSDADLIAAALWHSNVWHRRHAMRLILEPGTQVFRDFGEADESPLAELFYWRLGKVHGLELMRYCRLLVALADISRPSDAENPEEAYYFALGQIRRVLKEKGDGERKEAVVCTLLRDLHHTGLADSIEGASEGLFGVGGGSPSPRVRLVAASGLRRAPLSDRLPIAAALASRSEDADDHNLPLMTWYGVEPAVAAFPAEAVTFAAESKIPLLREYTARRITSELPSEPHGAALGALLERAALLTRSVSEGPRAQPAPPAATSSLTLRVGDDAVAFQQDVLTGALAALEGRRKVTPPPVWAEVQPVFAASADAEVKALANKLGVIFGDGAALEELRGVVTDRSASDAARVAAIDSLAEARDEAVAPVLIDLLKRQRGEDRNVFAAAARGLGAFESDEAAAVLLNALPRVRLEDRDALLATLVSRPSYGKKLAEALPGLGVTTLSAEHVRALRAFQDPEIDAVLDEQWGTTRATPEEKLAEIEAWKEKLAAAGEPDLGAGREAYKNVCGRCHKLYGEGGDLGPNLTGSDRRNLDYLLGNVFDPSAIVPAAWRVSTVLLADGRVLTGVVSDSNDATLTLATADATVTLPAGDVLEIEAGDASLMPEGLFKTLTETQVRDLIGYLRTQSAPR